MSSYKPGDMIMVKVGGVDYETFIDNKGVQRFKKNKLLSYLVDNGDIDLNKLARDYHGNMLFCFGIRRIVCLRRYGY